MSFEKTDPPELPEPLEPTHSALPREQVYARQLVLREIGGAGQHKLSAARVLIVGAGGLGCPAALYLAAAGVGTIGLVDPDRVEPSNLPRQILYDPQSIGQLKVEAAAAYLNRAYPQTQIVPQALACHAENVDALIASYDVIADCLDHFDARLSLSDACARACKPLVSAAAIGFAGHLSTFKPYAQNADGEDLPSYRCWVGHTPRVEEDCRNFGVLGAITGVMGSLAAVEVVKEVLGAGDSLAGRVLIYDGLSGTSRTVRLPRDPANFPPRSADDVPQPAMGLDRSAT